MTDYPEFIDNQNGNTLARMLTKVLSKDILAGSNTLEMVRIATAFFNPAGFARIADGLASVPNVRLMLGADPILDAGGIQKRLDETFTQFERRCLKAELRQLDDALRYERDRLPFSRSSSVALRKLATALAAGNIEVRRYEKSFLHAKAYIFTSHENGNNKLSGIIAGSSNLTGAGLAQNLELNLGRYDLPTVKRAHKWFDDLWVEAEPYDLVDIFEEALRPCTPWEIFVRVLWWLYGDEVKDDACMDNNLPLTNFQKHGVARALRLIRDMGGVIVADEVGLGKTFIAGEILQHYLEQRQRAVLICPASVRDSTWKHFLNDHRLFVECLSYEQLAGDIQLRDNQRPNADSQHLQRPLDEYQLVIVDEAHNYRNPDAPTRAAALRKLLFGRRRDLLLLTATPVNNSLWDLYHLLRFFLRQDAQLANRGILSIRERFTQAAAEDPSSLNPEMLYPVIDATTVKRTRQFVKKHYAGDTIKGPSGTPQPIVFPKPQAISLRYKLDDLLPDFFDRLEEALDPDDDKAILFARYRPEGWLLNQSNDSEGAHAKAAIGLLRSGLLKRFESSVYAFRQTLKKMLREHNAFLSALDAGYVVTTPFMQELSADDDIAFEEMLAATEHRADAALYDVDGLRCCIQRDSEILRELLKKTASVEANQDPKLDTLVHALIQIAEEAEHEAYDVADERQKRKVLVFSFFKDSVQWILDFLEQALESYPELAAYRGRMVAVSGSDDLAEVPRQKALRGFAPVSMGSPPGQDNDLYDLMIATDVLAEGVNLQQCRHIINFDMPWNPMRLVQRHGRIDRIGSPHDRVFLRTIFPADRLDQLLGLEQRILDKLAMAAASVGVEAPIAGAGHGRQVFSETREEIDRLLTEDATIYERGGTVASSQTGEEYRQTLRKALGQNHDGIVALPWNVGSSMACGDRRGVFFCAVVGPNTQFERTFLRFVEADADWRLKGEESAVEREMGVCLRLIECEQDTPTGQFEMLQDRVYDFWRRAQDDILHDWMRETDPANLQPDVRPLNRRVAEFIRAHPPIDFTEDKINRALDILESPWPRREETMLRSWFESSDLSGSELASDLIKQIFGTGIEPSQSPPPLPPIERSDIKLLCWMGINTGRAAFSGD